MSSSVRNRMVDLLKDQVDDVFADQEQRRRPGDEGEPDDGDRGAGQHPRHLALAGPADEDDTKQRQQDRSDLGGDERDDAGCVDVAAGWWWGGISKYRPGHLGDRISD